MTRLAGGRAVTALQATEATACGHVVRAGAPCRWTSSQLCGASQRAGYLLRAGKGMDAQEYSKDCCIAAVARPTASSGRRRRRSLTEEEVLEQSPGRRVVGVQQAKIIIKIVKKTSVCISIFKCLDTVQRQVWSAGTRANGLVLGHTSSLTAAVQGRSTYSLSDFVSCTRNFSNS